MARFEKTHDLNDGKTGSDLRNFGECESLALLILASNSSMVEHNVCA
jgi:hypothetical protein